MMKSGKNSIGSGELDSIVSAALEISKRRIALLERMRAAFESNDTLLALDLARELCGLKKTGDETDDRVN